jgi:hypothetical protein
MPATPIFKLVLGSSVLALLIPSSMVLKYQGQGFESCRTYINKLIMSKNLALGHPISIYILQTLQMYWTLKFV